ncbi:MAG: hypothetical protein ACQCXQ_04890 [Verrucomicrobiales bacterium]
MASNGARISVRSTLRLARSSSARVELWRASSAAFLPVPECLLAFGFFEFEVEFGFGELGPGEGAGGPVVGVLDADEEFALLHQRSA